MTKTMSKLPHGDIIFEFQYVGHVVKVSAIDTRTYTEVSIVGPANESREVLEATAIRKLRYVLAKKQSE